MVCAHHPPVDEIFVRSNFSTKRELSMKLAEHAHCSAYCACYLVLRSHLTGSVYSDHLNMRGKLVSPDSMKLAVAVLHKRDAAFRSNWLSELSKSQSATFAKNINGGYFLCGVALYYFGGILFSLLPTEERVSWEGHLFGFLSGVGTMFIMAYYF